MNGLCYVSYVMFLLSECFHNVLQCTLLYRRICGFRHIAPHNCLYFDMNQNRMRETAENKDRKKIQFLVDYLCLTRIDNVNWLP